ncbi:MAG: glutamate 5-kinase [Candidatus Thioglobus sp.]|jgi:glutamate 5-kinase|uniref:glutamate 5-kinase n=1 Tax=Candidatus Thioglobus sp. TaxID=2026721 RepID=UPI0001BD368E|nr:MAG: glutamate 5-kinase [uncultured Candidatus Thioglobus sp.]MBT3187323.1 glutamate 5-kinase [Candidatus Thioglobus sp.]MBT3431870.1 glutamate 5-kinase [Candidatus Thioglobus sp.]MBT3965757.1 glutamate 5-kinase [Candidatus Thioglobus sp.]MBT4316330.1 glutamate 5-kinase [Candidatus Thioglobus sp.]
MTKQRWVVKIGSALLTNDGKGLDTTSIASWVEQIVTLTKQNIDVILVSSGAIAEGIKRLGWNDRPDDIHKLQAAAAVGQMGLIQTYESLFAKHDMHTAQILLTHDNLTNADRYENISSTLNNLLEFGTVPIVNENDTVATDEIKFGDNDTLAALVANLVNADRLVILTDQGGVYDDDPRQNADAKLIDKIHVDDEKLEQVAGRTGGSLGSGGMYTKVLAAKKASESNTITVIASGKAENVLTRLQAGEHVGTLIHC